MGQVSFSDWSFCSESGHSSALSKSLSIIYISTSAVPIRSNVVLGEAKVLHIVQNTVQSQESKRIPAATQANK